MNRNTAYELLVAAVQRVSGNDSEVDLLEEAINPDNYLVNYGYDVAFFGEVVRDLEKRLNVPSLEMEGLLVPERFNTCTVGEVVNHLVQVQQSPLKREPIVVYVDDEEQNIFVFRRKFAKEFKLVTFSDPLEALDFIRQTPEVALVITDEVMPGLRGNELCTEVKKTNPGIEFILITGNPENDGDLLYSTLRQKRFYEFIQKPVDFDKMREEYLAMFRKLIGK